MGNQRKDEGKYKGKLQCSDLPTFSPVVLCLSFWVCLVHVSSHWLELCLPGITQCQEHCWHESNTNSKATGGIFTRESTTQIDCDNVGMYPKRS